MQSAMRPYHPVDRDGPFVADGYMQEGPEGLPTDMMAWAEMQHQQLGHEQQWVQHHGIPLYGVPHGMPHIIGHPGHMGHLGNQMLLPYPLATEHKPRLTKEQQGLLENHFQNENKPSTACKKTIAQHMGVPLDKINNWFQNRRAKARTAQKQLSKERERLQAAGEDGLDEDDDEANAQNLSTAPASQSPELKPTKDEDSPATISADDVPAITPDASEDSLSRSLPEQILTPASAPSSVEMSHAVPGFAVQDAHFAMYSDMAVVPSSSMHSMDSGLDHMRPVTNLTLDTNVNPFANDGFGDVINSAFGSEQYSSSGPSLSVPTSPPYASFEEGSHPMHSQSFSGMLPSMGQDRSYFGSDMSAPRDSISFSSAPTPLGMSDNENDSFSMSRTASQPSLASRRRRAPPAALPISQSGALGAMGRSGSYTAGMPMTPRSPHLVAPGEQSLRRIRSSGNTGRIQKPSTPAQKSPLHMTFAHQMMSQDTPPPSASFPESALSNVNMPNITYAPSAQSLVSYNAVQWSAAPYSAPPTQHSFMISDAGNVSPGGMTPSPTMGHTLA